MPACKDCTRPAELSAWDFALPGTQGVDDICGECASRRSLVVAEEAITRMRGQIERGRLTDAMDSAQEAGARLMDTVATLQIVKAKARQAA